MKQGGIFKGKSHIEGGIKAKVVDTGQIIEVEGDEGILNKNTMRSNETVKIDGKILSLCEAASELNQKGGGVAFNCNQITEKGKTVDLNEFKKYRNVAAQGMVIKTKPKTIISKTSIPKHYKGETVNIANHIFDIEKAYQLIADAKINASIVEVNPKELDTKITATDKNKAKKIENNYAKPIGLLLRLQGSKNLMLIDGNHRTMKAVADKKAKALYYYISNANDIHKFYSTNEPTKWYADGGYISRYDDAKKEASEIRKYIAKKLGIDVNVSTSVTDFGTSLYVQSWETSEKIRISDHSVTNFDRMWNERHYSLAKWKNKSFILDVEQIFFPDRFTVELYNELSYNTSSHIYPTLDDWKKDWGENETASLIKDEEFINKKGVKKRRITWRYGKTIEKTRIIRKKDNNNTDNYAKGNIIPQKKFYISTPEHAKEYGIIAKKPLYIQTINTFDTKGSSVEILKEIEQYAKDNNCDVVFGYIAQKAKFYGNIKDCDYCNDPDKIKLWLFNNGYAINEHTNDFHKVINSNTSQLTNNNMITFTPNEFASLENIIKTISDVRLYDNTSIERTNEGAIINFNNDVITLTHGLVALLNHQNKDFTFSFLSTKSILAKPNYNTKTNNVFAEGTILESATTNEISNGSYFINNPEKILGKEINVSTAYGDSRISYKGGLELLDKIEISEQDFSKVIAGNKEGGYRSSEQSQDVLTSSNKSNPGNSPSENLEKAIDISSKELSNKTISKIEQAADVMYTLPSTDNVLSFEESYHYINPAKKGQEGVPLNTLTPTELEVFIWYQEKIGRTLSAKWYGLIDVEPFKYGNSSWSEEQIQKWLHNGDIFYENGDYIPAYLYLSGNIYKKYKDLLENKNVIVTQYGENIYNVQHSKLSEVLTRIESEKLFIIPTEFNEQKEPANQLFIKAMSKFAKEFTIETLKDEKEFKVVMSKAEKTYGKPNFDAAKNDNGDWYRDKFEKLSLSDAFIYWLKFYTSDFRYKKSGVNWQTIKDFYVYKKQYNKRRDEDRGNYERKCAINQQEGERLFTYFLQNWITDHARKTIENEWNIRYNGTLPIDYDKIPLAFACTKKELDGSPIEFRFEKREAVACTVAEGNMLLAYQVGTGKTRSAIFTIAQFLENGYCKRPLIVVPNQTYKQWLSEINHLLPQYKINSLYNLSRDYVNELRGVGHWEYKHSGDRVNPSHIFKDKKGVLMVGENHLTAERLDDVANFNDIEQVEAYTISVMTYEGFKSLTFKESTQNETASDLHEILNQGEEVGTKKAEAKESKIEGIVGKALGTKSKYPINIEDLGVDYVTLDEAHAAKKVFTAIKGEVSDTGTRDKNEYRINSGTPSAMALKTFAIFQYIQRNNNGNNIQLLTATPFTNSPLEVYSMLALISYQKLKNSALKSLVTFFDQYVDVQTELVINAKLNPERKQVFKGYNNLPALQRLIMRFMNYKEAGKIYSKGRFIDMIRPEKWVLPLKYRTDEKGNTRLVDAAEQIKTDIPLNELQSILMSDVKAYVEGHIDLDELVSEANNTFGKISLNASVDVDETIISETGEDTMVDTDAVELNEDTMSDDEKAGVRVLRGVNYARSLALSPYLYIESVLKRPINVDYKTFIETSPKFKYTMECIKSVKKWHEANNQEVSGQVIYMDRGKDHFELIKEYLVKEIGYKEHEVGIIKSGSDKDAIKNKFLGQKFDEALNKFVDIPYKDRMKIVIGSSSIKEGINLQRYSSVLYNLFLDFNPTDLVQINGRIHRQGNVFKDIRIVIPTMRDSMDIFMLQKLEEKTERINAIWDTDGKTSVIRTDEFDPKELKMQLVSDPKVIASMEVDYEKEKIDDEIQSILNNINYAKKTRTLLTQFDDGYGFNQLRKAVNEHMGTKERSYDSILSNYKKLVLGWKKDKKAEEIKINPTYGWKDYYAENRQLKSLEKDFIKPNGLSLNINHLDDFVKDIEYQTAELSTKKAEISSDEAIERRAKEITEERTKKNIKETSVEERVASFKTLNHLLNNRRVAKNAEQFNKIDLDMCPPMDKDGNRLIDSKSIAKLEACLKELPQTKHLHTEGDKETYKPERLQLHDKIIAEMREGAVCIKREQPIAILTGGMAGSGKSTFMKQYAQYLTSDKIFSIDADEVRAKLPEYKGWNADQTHKETSDIVGRLLDGCKSAEPCKYDILYDGTMNKTKNYIPLIKKIKGLGYKVYIIFLQIPAEVSRERVLQRYKKHGRYVPMIVTQEGAEAGLSAFEGVKQLVDGYILVDGITREIIEQKGEEIPKDRNYFGEIDKYDNPKDSIADIKKMVNTLVAKYGGEQKKQETSDYDTKDKIDKFVSLYKGHTFKLDNVYIKNGAYIPFKIIGLSSDKDYPITVKTVEYRGLKRKVTESNYKLSSIISIVKSIDLDGYILGDKAEPTQKTIFNTGGRVVKERYRKFNGERFKLYQDRLTKDEAKQLKSDLIISGIATYVRTNSNKFGVSVYYI